MRMITLDIAAKATATDLTCKRSGLGDLIVLANSHRCDRRSIHLDTGRIRCRYNLLLSSTIESFRHKIRPTNLWQEGLEQQEQCIFPERRQQ